MAFSNVSGYTASPLGGGGGSGGLSFGQVAGGLGYGLQGLSSYMGGQAQAASYVGGASSAKFASEETKRKSKYSSWRSQLALQLVSGSQRNAYGVAGIELEGTAVDVLAETAKELTLDRLMEQRNAKAEAYGYKLQEADYKKAAKASKQSGVMGMISAGIGIAGLLI